MVGLPPPAVTCLAGVAVHFLNPFRSNEVISRVLNAKYCGWKKSCTTLLLLSSQKLQYLGILSGTWTPQACRITAFWAVFKGLGPLLFIL